MKLTFHPILTMSALALCFALRVASAQDNPNLEQGMKPYGDFHGGDIDSINLGNGNLTLAIGIWDYPQRGSIKMPVALRYNSKIWSNQVRCGAVSCAPHWEYMGIEGGGLSAPYVNDGDYSTSSSSSPFSFSIGTAPVTNCSVRFWPPPIAGQVPPIDCTSYTPDGSAHPNGSLTSQPGLSYVTVDGTAIFSLVQYSVNPITNTPIVNALSSDRNGFFSLFGEVEDSDGNIAQASTVSTGALTDTRGISVPVYPTVSNYQTTDYSRCPDPAVTTLAYQVTVPAPPGVTPQWTFCYTRLTLQTSFPFNLGASIAPFSNASADANSITVLDGVVLPTGDYWKFGYDSYADVTYIHFPTGASLSYQYQTHALCDLTNIFSQSQYAAFISQAGWTPVSRFVTSRTLDRNDGTGPHTWTYGWSSEITTPTSRYFTVTVTDPDNNDTVHTETGLSNSCSFYETNEQVYQGSASSGKVLKTIQTDYSSMLSPANNSNWQTLGQWDAINVVPIHVTTTTPDYGGRVVLRDVSRVEKDFDYPMQFYIDGWDGVFRGPYSGTFANVSQERDYDFGILSWGSLLRKSTTVYMADNGSYQQRPDLVYSEKVEDGNGNTLSMITHGYDEFSRQSSGITTGKASSLFPTLMAPGVVLPLPNPGHQTSETKTVDTSGKTIRSCKTYYDTGMLASSSDGMSSATSCSGANWTTYSYDSAYAGAYRTKTQKPTTGSITHIVSGGYDFNTGLLTSFTDENSVLSKYSYSDPLARITDAQIAVGTPSERWTHFAYPSLFEIDAKKDQMSKGDGLIQNTQIFDGVGRILSNQALSDGAGAVWIDTTYDAMGRVHSTSNPYRPSVKASSGFVTFGYDALSRQLYKCNQDNGTGTGACSQRGANTESWGYYGNRTLYSDENNNQWARTSNALGQLTQVFEPSGAATYYVNDALGNLTCLAQDGGAGGGFSGCSSTPASWIRRTFSYDYLSRLLVANNPETGSLCFGVWTGATCSGGYDNNGNLVAKTDARGVVTGYKYDVLNRLLSRTYTSAPAGTVSSCYQYDNLTAGTNGKARLWFEWTQPGTCSSSFGAVPTTGPNAYQAMRGYGGYDAAGRIVSEVQCVAGYCTSVGTPASPAPKCTSLSGGNGLQYCYDLAGNLLAYSNGVTPAAAGSFPQMELTFSQTFDGVNRLANVNSSWSDTTHPANLFKANGTAATAPAYTPFNALKNWLLGSNLYTSRSFDCRTREWSQTSSNTQATAATPPCSD